MSGRDSRAGLKSVMDGLVPVGQTIVNEGRLRIGALNGDLSANSSVTAAGVNDTGGSIVLEGNGSNQALLDVTGAADLGTAAGQLDGIVTLQSNHAIEFASGALTTIETGGRVQSLWRSGVRRRLRLARIGQRAEHHDG
jgi:hypothetical protein